MAYPRVEPVAEKKMRRRRYQSHHTICQVLREIYALADSEEVKYKSRVAMAMAKKMHERLKYYKQREAENG